MVTLRDAHMEVAVSADGAQVALIHLATGSRWELDPATRLADASGNDRVGYGANRRKFGENKIDPIAAPPVPFTDGSVELQGDRTAIVRRSGPAGTLTLRFELQAEGLRIAALPQATSVTGCALPGAFRPAGGGPLEAVLAKNQGIWHRGTGGAFSYNLERSGHSGVSLPFFATVGPREALLGILENEEDSRIWFEKSAAGDLNLCTIADPSQGRMAFERAVVLRFTSPDLTSIARSYRQWLHNKIRVPTWADKIAARPNLEKLFGALMCFIGYCQDPEVDYAAGFQRLQALGFDRAYVYPLCIGNPVEGFRMGGAPPIDIRPLLSQLTAQNYLTAGWMWVEDLQLSLGHGPMRLNAAGEPHGGWQIDEMRWYSGCPVSQVAISHRIQAERMQGFTAQHFDVTASRNACECHHPDHPLDHRADTHWRLEVLCTAQRRGAVVSSEGFWGTAAAAGAYDIGTVKIPEPVHADWFTVPITSLVFHDSMVHDWWEIDNYNNPRHRNQFDRDKTMFPLNGGDHAALQAAQDALGGWPPNVFPFGLQYNYVNGQGPKAELYRFRLEDAAVQDALRRALPLTRLHRRIGKLDCVGFERLAADGSLQATTFADGTRVVANFSDEAREITGVGLVPPRDWRATDL